MYAPTSSESARQGSPEQQDDTSQSRYPPSVVSSVSSIPETTSSSISSSSNYSFSPSHDSPAEVAAIISILKGKSVDELQNLLSDEDAYSQLLLSLDQVKIQNIIRDELRKETVQLARDNLEKEPRIMELRNQCRIVRTIELAVAQEKLNDLERQKDVLLRSCSPASLLQKLQEAANKIEEESETLHRQLLDREIDLGAFVQKYRKLRSAYHRQELILLASKTALTV
ncbi:unnamed protein product [Dovyalis caffra]|uniref:VPS37 C-terminal domain-containing protein n=1 Tax=Dovyalis caffra TaxID=77055 RepID=A0AAV1SKE4_9ROSI|nr:unnamed protein product [Dovyalis caffra]